MTLKDRLVKVGKKSASSGDGGWFGFFLRAPLRLVQLIAALIVVGLYAPDLRIAHEAGEGGAPEWTFAMTIAGFSAATVLIYMIPFVRWRYLFVWDAVLFLLWAIVFGMAGKEYLPRDARYEKDEPRMKVAAWFDLANMLLWFITACLGAFFFLRGRKKKPAPTTTLP